MECVNCTACIDACDHIMDKVGFERGLIRYASENAIVQKTSKLITTRVVGYTVVLLLLWSGLGFMVATRNDTQTTLFRAPGSQYIENKDGTISNLYTFKIFNKTNQTIKPTIRLDNPKGKLLFAGSPDLTLDAAGMSEGTVFIIIPKSALTRRKTTLTLSVYQGPKKLEGFETTFMAPEE
jgi:hypothetical protein